MRWTMADAAYEHAVALGFGIRGLTARCGMVAVSPFALVILPATAVAALLTIGLLCAGWPWSLLALWPAASTWLGVRLVRMTWGWGS